MNKRTKYLAFCGKCGNPQIIPEYILQTYWNLSAVNGYYCENDSCQHLNEIPEHLRKIIKDL